MLSALSFWLEEPKRVVIAGERDRPALLRAAHAVFQPNKVVLGTSGPVEEFARTLPVKDGKATVYLCTGTSCSLPTHDPDQVKSMLK
jgi:uncharacterized protein YyaL (SSP411 family)